MSSTKDTGHFYEHLAEEYLSAKGYDLVDRNYHSSNKGEIDIIMKDNDYYVFVEVKYMKFSEDYSIYERITKTKKKRLYKAVSYWLARHKLYDVTWRVDFVGIVTNQSKTEILHYQNIDLGLNSTSGLQ